MRPPFFLVSGVLLGAAFSLHAAPVLPHIFGDHMVLQSGMADPVWGTASPGEKVEVKFAGQDKTATADATGRWEVKLDPLTASATAGEMTVSAPSGTVTFTDVLVGETWLCSGQSNMEKPLGEQKGQKPTLNAVDDIKAANFPTIRLFKVPKTKAAAPAADVQGQWQVCTPQAVDGSKFSAAGYFFGRKLNQQLGVPVGLIDSTWGGTRIELWTPAGAFAKEKSLADLAEAAKTPGAKAEGVVPSVLYNGQIAPLAPYAIKGVIWYQGESNLMDVNDSATYPDKMVALLHGWRSTWGEDFPFYYVLIAPHLYHVVRSAQVASPEAEPVFWEAQASFLKREAKTGMIVTTDLVDNLLDIHPRDKKTVGERLANWALNKNYNRTDLPLYGPVFKSMKIEGTKAIITFDHAEGLKTKDQKAPNWFTIAGKNGIIYPAQAIINGETVEVSSPHVSKPAIIRFAWDEGAQPNLFNKDGLPALPFRSNVPSR